MRVLIFTTVMVIMSDFHHSDQGLDPDAVKFHNDYHYTKNVQRQPNVSHP